LTVQVRGAVHVVPHAPQFASSIATHRSPQHSSGLVMDVMQ
jgi:hypothetical protein